MAILSKNIFSYFNIFILIEFLFFKKLSQVPISDHERLTGLIRAFFVFSIIALSNEILSINLKNSDLKK